MTSRHTLKQHCGAAHPPMAGISSIEAALPAEPPAWVGSWIGLPFRLGGRGPADFDCWGLARAVLAAEFGIDAPAYERGYPEDARDRAALADLVSHGMPGWRPIAEGDAARSGIGERPGDLILMRHGRHACHIGMVVARGTMLHIEEGTDSSLDRYDGPRWRRRLAGIYRHATVA